MCKFAIITHTYISFLPFQADYFFGENTGGSGMYKRIIRFVDSITSIRVMSDFNMSTSRVIATVSKAKARDWNKSFTHTDHPAAGAVGQEGLANYLQIPVLIPEYLP